MLQRFAFSVDSGDKLVFFAFDGSWSEQSLGPLSGQQVFPESRLQACLTGDGLEVFFQDPSKTIRRIGKTRHGWTDLGVLPCQPREGTPMSVAFVPAENSIYLYYVAQQEQDECVRRVRISKADGTFDGRHSFPRRAKTDAKRFFADIQVPGASFKYTVENLIAFRGGSDEESEVILLAEDRVIRVDGKGDEAEIGTMDGREFTASKSDQFYDNIFMPFMPIYAPGWGIGQCCVQ
jgi:hypothetical protein